MNFADIEGLVRQGESEALEFKKSTGQLSRAAETLCGFLNRRGGRVLIGVSPTGKIVGQLVTDATLQDVAQILRRFDPPTPVQIQRVRMPVLVQPEMEEKPLRSVHRLDEPTGLSLGMVASPQCQLPFRPARSLELARLLRSQLPDGA